MKSIIVPTDFSPVSINAVNYAVDMAKAIQASVILLHVYQVPVTFTDVPVVNISVEELAKGSMEKLHKLKSDIEHITSGSVKVYAESQLGEVVDQIEALCDRIDPFAVVMGTKGASPLERLFLGSNTLTAIRHLAYPLIVVPPGAVFSAVKKIGFACDFNEVVETTPASKILSVCNTFGARLHVLNVDYHSRNFRPDTPEQSLLLHTLLESAHPVYDYIEDPDVVEGIHRYAETRGFDMIITIPRKHRLLAGLFQKTHTRDMVFHAHIPIMCIHEPD